MKQKLETLADTIVCKPGSVRSLAKKVESILKTEEVGDPGKKAFDFAREVNEKFGEDFTQEDAKRHFVVYFGSTATKKSTKKTTTTKKEVKEFSPKAKGIVNNDALSKNERIRNLLSMGYGISQISKEMKLSYQRVKNVKKKDEEKKSK